jgi:hypothetical protein
VRVNDAVIGVIVVRFALAMVWHTRTFPSMPGQDYGSAPFLALIGIGMIVRGGILIAGGLARRPARLRHGGERLSDRAGDPRHRARALVEDNFMTTMIKSNGALRGFFSRPIAAVLGVITLPIWARVIIGWIWRAWPGRRHALGAESAG